jgi:hypothetical protein
MGEISNLHEVLTKKHKEKKAARRLKGQTGKQH